MRFLPLLILASRLLLTVSLRKYRITLETKVINFVKITLLRAAREPETLEYAFMSFQLEVWYDYPDLSGENRDKLTLWNPVNTTLYDAMVSAQDKGRLT